MFKMIAATLLLAVAGIALASDASFEQKQIRDEKTAPAPKDAGAKPMTTACGCPHGHA